MADAIIGALVGGTITGAASFAAIRVHLHWLRRDVDELRERVYGAK